MRTARAYVGTMVPRPYPHATKIARCSALGIPDAPHSPPTVNVSPHPYTSTRNRPTVPHAILRRSLYVPMPLPLPHPYPIPCAGYNRTGLVFFQPQSTSQNPCRQNPLSCPCHNTASLDAHPSMQRPSNRGRMPQARKRNLLLPRLPSTLQSRRRTLRRCQDLGAARARALPRR